jgi:hypothetical protein
MSGDELINIMFERERSGSLYASGYTDGYNEHPFEPCWYPMGVNASEKIDASSEMEIQEYRAGYDTGKFNFSIDRKRSG